MTLSTLLMFVLGGALLIGGAELLLLAFGVPQYVLPRPSEIARALVTDFHLIAPHLGHTLVELLSGFTIGAVTGLVLAAVITQFPFAEKIITPYILLLVTTPMLALVPLLILRFGFGYEPRIIAVALASGPMVMINATTGFRRVDSGKIALARSYGASTLQIFWKIRAPMALPMIFVGLMVGSILIGSMLMLPEVSSTAHLIWSRRSRPCVSRAAVRISWTSRCSLRSTSWKTSPSCTRMCGTGAVRRSWGACFPQGWPITWP